MLSGMIFINSKSLLKSWGSIEYALSADKMNTMNCVPSLWLAS